MSHNGGNKAPGRRRTPQESAAQQERTAKNKLRRIMKWKADREFWANNEVYNTTKRR